MRALIPAAGEGVRVRPVTYSVPKEMFPIGRYPAIEWILSEACQSGVTEAVVVISPKKKIIQQYLVRRSPAAKHFDKLEFIIQEAPTGLGHALLLAAEFLGGEPFAVLLPDDLYSGKEQPLVKMDEKRQELGGSILALTKEPGHLSQQYGNFALEAAGADTFSVRGVLSKGSNHGSAEFMAGLGRYVMDPSCLDYATRLFKNHTVGELTDGSILNEMLENDEKIHAVAMPGRRFDITSPEGMASANASLGNSAPIWPKPL